MGKSCGWPLEMCLGEQYYDLGHPTGHCEIKTSFSISNFLYFAGHCEIKTSFTVPSKKREIWNSLADQKSK